MGGKASPDLGAQAGQVSVESLDWSAAAAHELPARLGVPYVDVVIGCDIILEHLFGAAALLAEFLGALAHAHAGLRVLMAAELRPNCGVWAFLQRAAADFDIKLVMTVDLVHLYE